MSRPPIIRIAAGSLCLATTAAAQPFVIHEGFSPDPSQRVTVTRVPYSDIDLASPEGAQRLLRRIQAAAEAVCGGSNTLPAADKAAYETCRDEAISGAVTRLDSPTVKALAASDRRGHP